MLARQAEKQLRGLQPVPAWQAEKQLRGVRRVCSRRAETQLRGVQTTRAAISRGAVA
jgi:hypothetical protein